MVAPSVDAPVISEAPSRHVLYQRFNVTEAEIGTMIQRSLTALYKRISDAGVVPAGPPFVIYDSETSPWDIKICAPIATPMSPSDEFQYIELPATRIVSLSVIGPYDQLAGAYVAIQKYIHDHDLKITGAPREVYLSPPDTPPSQVRTVIEWPVA